MSIASKSYAFTQEKTRLIATWVQKPSVTIPDGFTFYKWPLDLVGLEYNKDYKIACIVPEQVFYLSFLCGGLEYRNCKITTESTTNFTPLTVHVKAQTSGAINAIYVNGIDILFSGIGGNAETASDRWQIIGTTTQPEDPDDIINTQITINNEHAN